MADINQIIEHGIGASADIEHFILVGLSANPNVVLIDLGQTETRSLMPERDGASLMPERDTEWLT